MIKTFPLPLPFCFSNSVKPWICPIGLFVTNSPDCTDAGFALRVVFGVLRGDGRHFVAFSASASLRHSVPFWEVTKRFCFAFISVPTVDKACVCCLSQDRGKLVSKVSVVSFVFCLKQTLEQPFFLETSSEEKLTLRRLQAVLLSVIGAEGPSLSLSYIYHCLRIHFLLPQIHPATFANSFSSPSDSSSNLRQFIFFSLRFIQQLSRIHFLLPQIHPATFANSFSSPSDSSSNLRQFIFFSLRFIQQPSPVHFLLLQIHPATFANSFSSPSDSSGNFVTCHLYV